MYGKNGELLVHYHETEAGREGERRRSSIPGAGGVRNGSIENKAHANPDYKLENGFSNGSTEKRE